MNSHADECEFVLEGPAYRAFEIENEIVRVATFQNDALSLSWQDLTYRAYHLALLIHDSNAVDDEKTANDGSLENKQIDKSAIDLPAESKTAVASNVHYPPDASNVYYPPDQPNQYTAETEVTAYTRVPDSHDESIFCEQCFFANTRNQDQMVPINLDKKIYKK